MDETSWIQFKTAIHNKCLEIVQQQLDTIQSSMDQLMEAKSNETKSSAGDKYETGMAMIQNQEDLYKRQQIDAKQRWNVLQSIDSQVTNNSIGTGTLVHLSTGWFYIAVAIGKIEVDHKEVYIISKASPLGTLLRGKREADSLIFNQKTILINSIL
ncbi:transcription elongation factor [Nonlabens agnitus]|uniref:3-oxoacyl-ACP synthase n=1 Tax=Nonlabens agnitus TaxID=870484 RepID=A0A2S9WR52_9FLAO|nr:transcription elongation factor [Nonlabens agnitus]PRP65948.1 hypothetical protein BST86_02025 [Nonlabens agnitus]